MIPASRSKRRSGCSVTSAGQLGRGAHLGGTRRSRAPSGTRAGSGRPGASPRSGDGRGAGQRGRRGTGRIRGRRGHRCILARGDGVETKDSLFDARVTAWSVGVRRARRFSTTWPATAPDEDGGEPVRRGEAEPPVDQYAGDQGWQEAAGADQTLVDPGATAARGGILQAGRDAGLVRHAAAEADQGSREDQAPEPAEPGQEHQGHQVPELRSPEAPRSSARGAAGPGPRTAVSGCPGSHPGTSRTGRPASPVARRTEAGGR